MTWFPLLVLLGSLLASVCSNPLLSQRELAPSLVLERINLLRDSIDKLQQMNTRVRCHIKAVDSPSRNKRYIGPSQHLDEMIATLQLGDLPMTNNDDC